MALELGMQLPRLVLRWASGAEQAFSFQVLGPTGVPATWSGTDAFRLKIDGDTLNAVLTLGGYVNFTFTGAQSKASYIGKTARLEYLSGTNVYLYAQGTVVPA